MRRTLPLVLTLALGAASCDGDGARDTVTDMAASPSVWQADGKALLAALPRQVAGYHPTEGADSFATSYRSGPVFGASATYGDGARTLVIRVEGGNVRERAAAVIKGHANPGESFVTKDVTVHGVKGTLHWNEVGITGELVFVLDRRLLVTMRVVPAKSEREIVELAEGMDVGPLLAAPLQGVGR